MVLSLLLSYYDSGLIMDTGLIGKVLAYNCLITLPFPVSKALPSMISLRPNKKGLIDVTYLLIS